MQEFEFINNLLKPLVDPELALNLEDDVAILPAGKQLIFSTDTIIEEVHFNKNMPASIVAHKLLGSNISDIAAKAATPLYYSLNLSLTKNIDIIWLEEFCERLKIIQKKYNIFLLGGDTTSFASTQNNIVLSCTIFGEVKGKFIPRNGAKEGEDIWVTGQIGDAMAGFFKLESDNYDLLYHCSLCAEIFRNNKEITESISLEYKSLIPSPRLEIKDLLLKYASSSIDVSDGLLQDLKHILSASNVGASVNIADIPQSERLKSFIKLRKDLRESQYNWGDDYEVIFTAAKKHAVQIKRISKKLNLPITKIGEVMKGNELEIISKKKVKIKGFQHRIC